MIIVAWILAGLVFLLVDVVFNEGLELGASGCPAAPVAGFVVEVCDEFFLELCGFVFHEVEVCCSGVCGEVRVEVEDGLDGGEGFDAEVFEVIEVERFFVGHVVDVALGVEGGDVSVEVDETADDEDGAGDGGVHAHEPCV